MIDDFRLWGSSRCRQMGRHLSDGGWRTNIAAILSRTTPFSQRAKFSPLWLETSPRRRIRQGTTRIARDRCGKANARLRLACPPSVQSAVRGGDSGAGPQRVIKGSQPTQRHTLGLARGSAPSNPDRGELPPSPITPAAPFSRSRDGGIDGARGATQVAAGFRLAARNSAHCSINTRRRPNRSERA